MNQGLGDTTDREQWGLQSMLDKVIGKEKQEKAEKAEKAEGWSLKTLFGVGKKWRRLINQALLAKNNRVL